MSDSDDTLRVGLIQHAAGDEIERNLAAAEAGAREAAAAGARLLLMQELHPSRYFCQAQQVATFDLAEPIPGPTTRRLGALAAELGVVVVTTLFERRAPGIYHNTAVVLDRDGTLAGTYRKMHIPDDPGFHEKFYFTPGDQGFRPIDTSLGRLGVLVCWDQWYPEAARLMALAGSRLLLYPTAIGWHPPDDEAEKQRQREAWITVQRGHAVANHLPVLACNRVGHEPDPNGGPGIVFWGNSFACGPQGELLGQASQSGPETLVVDLPLARTEGLRRIWPFLRDRRIDAYGDLVRRFRDPEPTA
ncbi:MAG: carbon-nitrogen hydrolase [Gammaproteobacteria bacterium]|nr:carbon-nitrogen hydrolase [Gammaproteobacteria bacterium]